MPELVDVDLEARVGRAIETRRAAIEELVRQRVDVALTEIVDQELAAALERLAERNGDGNFRQLFAAPREPAATPAPSPSSSSDPPPATSTALCRDCGERPAAPGRQICSRCKSRRERARRRERETAPAGAQGGQGDEDPARPGPDPAAPAGEHAAPPSASPARFALPAGAEAQARAEERRAAIEAARRNGVEQVERDGRSYTLIHIPPERLTAQALAERAGTRAGRGLNADELERWLTESKLATVDDDGRLHATGHALHVGGVLDPA